jgi:hypothetical protein
MNSWFSVASRQDRPGSEPTQILSPAFKPAWDHGHGRAKHAAVNANATVALENIISHDIKFNGIISNEQAHSICHLGILRVIDRD